MTKRLFAAEQKVPWKRLILCVCHYVPSSYCFSEEKSLVNINISQIICPIIIVNHLLRPFLSQNLKDTGPSELSGSSCWTSHIWQIFAPKAIYSCPHHFHKKGSLLTMVAVMILMSGFLISDNCGKWGEARNWRLAQYQTWEVGRTFDPPCFPRLHFVHWVMNQIFHTFHAYGANYQGQNWAELVFGLLFLTLTTLNMIYHHYQELST